MRCAIAPPSSFTHPKRRRAGGYIDGLRPTLIAFIVAVFLQIADSTRQCNFTHGMMREAAMPKCFSPSKVKEHECEPITASLRGSVTKFMH